jgi:hypothetical protein
MTAWLLNMQPIDCAETSVVSCQTTSCNIPKVRRPLQSSSLKTGRGVAAQLSCFSFCLGFRSKGRAFRLAFTSFPAVPLYNWRHSKLASQHTLILSRRPMSSFIIFLSMRRFNVTWSKKELVELTHTYTGRQ